MNEAAPADNGERRDSGDIGLSSLLQDILKAVPGRAASIHTPLLRPGEPGSIWRAAGLPQEALSDYATRFRDLDLWAQAASRNGPPPTGAVLDTDQLLDPGQLLRSTFHNEYLTRYDIGRCLVAIVDDGRGPALPRIRMAVVRAASEPRFTATDADRMAQLAVLARSFVLLAGARDEAIRAMQLQRAAFDMVAMPVLLVDRGRRVEAANRAATAMIRAGGPLLLRQGRLHVHGAADRDLEQALQRAAAGPRDVRFIRLAPGRRSPALVISALHDDPALQGMLAVRLLDPQVGSEDGAVVLRQLLDLTPAETAVALGVAEGLAHEEIALRRAVKVTTVRTTLRRLQEKLGIQRTAPLARFIHTVTTLGGLRL